MTPVSEFPPGFGWDPDKDAINKRRHKLGFDTAVRVFIDPHGFDHDTTYKDGEIRFSYLGMADGKVLYVVYHDRTDENGESLTWIISARDANKGETNAYFKR